jgi:hypothetical protein
VVSKLLGTERTIRRGFTILWHIQELQENNLGPVRNLSARLKSVERMKDVRSSTCTTPGKRAVAPPAPGV